MIRKKTILLILFGLLTPVIIYSLFWIVTTDLSVQEKFSSNTFLAPTQFYSNSLDVSINQTLSEKNLLDLLQKNNYRQKSWGSVLQKSDYSLSQGEDCEKIYQESLKCIAFFHHLSQKINIIATDELNRVLVLLETDPETQISKNLNHLILFPQMFAQYMGDKPVLQTPVQLSSVPRQCLDAALAIEDPQFLEHQGVSFRGLARALIVNLLHFRVSQGGSTITQQLVKNHFLTSERTFSRKIREILMAFIVERRIPKDKILETYLNIIYLGQQGNFQIRGYSAAADFYFQKQLSELNLGECALLGAIINSPGLFNPFKNPDRALARREKVLNAMLDQNRILIEDKNSAQAQPLPQKTMVEIRETAPYFIEGVVDELRTQGFYDLSGFKIFTSLDLQAQSFAQKAVQNHLNQLESSSAYHQKNKSHSLQAVLVASNPQNGDVVALVGGRDHRSTPFNRVFDSARQVGSIFKPLVYLTGFAKKENFNLLSPLENEPWTYKYGKQEWKPKNYDGKYSPSVPAFYALKESLNIPTSHLAMDVGLETIIAVAEDLGVHSPMKPFPSLSLGSFEMTPIEVLQVYTNIARWGSTRPLRLVKHVENLEGQILYSLPTNDEVQVLEKGDFVNLVSAMQETMISGTGQSAKVRGLQSEIAGKTGTTTDYKDAWFAGFSANHVAIVWTGYDDNTPVKLSGATGALPIWTDYMISLSSTIESLSFQWPTENVSTIHLSPEELIEKGVPVEKAHETQLQSFKK